MTVQSTDRKAGPFFGGTILPFEFKVFSKEDIQVIWTSAAGVESILVLDSEYSVTLNPDQDNTPGGSVTLNTAISGGANTVIIGDLIYDQGTDIRNQSGFEPETIEDALDRVTILVQQLLEMAKRTLRIPASSSSSISTQLPQPTAGNVLGWNGEANQLVNLSPQDIATTVAFGTAFVDQFEGDDVETEFSLSANPALLANMDVQVDGVSLRNGIDFVLLAGAVIKFTTPPAAPSVPGEPNIQVRGTVAVPQGFDTADVVVTQLPESGLWTTVQGFINRIVSSIGASIVGFIQNGVYAIQRSVQDKLREYVSVSDYASFQDAINTGRHVTIPDGVMVTVSEALTGLVPGQVIKVQGVVLAQVAKWLGIDGADYTKVVGFGGEVRFDSAVINNRDGVSSIGAGIHITNSSYVEVSGLKVTALNSDRTLTSFVVGTKSSVGSVVRDNVLTNIGIGVIAGWTDDVTQQDLNDVPTSKWTIKKNTFNNCGRAAYANIMIRSKNNSFSRTDPYAYTAHRIIGNKTNGLGGGGASDIAIEYWSNGGVIRDNVLIGNDVDTFSHIAISCAKAYDKTITGNEIRGAWNYQGIELATCDSCIVSNNKIYGLTNADANCAAVGVSVAVVGDPASNSNIIQGNAFVDCKVGVLTGGASTAVPYAAKTVITGNSFEGTTQRSVYNFGQNTLISGNSFKGATPVEVLYGSVDVVGNYITTTSPFALYALATAGEVNVKNNKFEGWGTSGQNGAIYFTHAASGQIVGNKFLSDGRSQSGWSFGMVALVKPSAAGSANDTPHFVGNDNFYSGVLAQLPSAVGAYGPFNTGIGRSYYSDMFVSGVPNKVIFGGSAPTAGTWAVGDRCMNTAPAASGNIGWVCVTAGTPGTWKTFGAISA